MKDNESNKTTPPNWGCSYGDVVKREFFKNKFSVVSLWLIVLLFVIAILAPFLANDKPFYICVEGQWQFPLFRSLQALDYAIFWATLIGLLILLLMQRNRQIYDPSIRGEVLVRQLFAATGLIVLGTILLYYFCPVYLDRTDYKQLAKSDKVSAVLFPAVPYAYGRTDLSLREQPPSKEHWFGTDDVGSDVLCRLIYGSRISLSVGFVSVGISSLIGVFIGAILGYFGGWVDFLGMRLVEIMMAVPTFFLIITVVAFFPRSLLNIMIIIGITGWTGNARFVRAEFFKLRKQDFVQAALSLGLPLRSIMFKHMLPNGVAPVLVNATFGVAGAIFTEASLSYLGFGVVPPTPSWGQMLSLGLNISGQFLWWLTLFPGLAIFITVTAYNLVGEGLRDAIDPRLRKAA